MRALSAYSLAEWLRGWPARHALKQWRNDWMCARYVRQPPSETSPAWASLLQSPPGNLALVVAFEQPWYIQWQLDMASRCLPDWRFVVLDNSRTAEARQAIRVVCEAAGAPCIGLPANPTRHVNRSHSLAMQWAFERVVRPLKPSRFAFLDHDLIPFAPIDLAAQLQGQACYGMLVESPWAWQLWAGYCVFDFQQVAQRPLNFLYDFANGLDTGGRNHAPLYRHLDRSRMRFAAGGARPIRVPVDPDHPDDASEAAAVQTLDDCWLHVGGVSYNGNAQRKQALARELHRQITLGEGWPAASPGGGQRATSAPETASAAPLFIEPAP